jgi:hypothetical protein
MHMLGRLPWIKIEGDNKEKRVWKGQVGLTRELPETGA